MHESSLRMVPKNYYWYTNIKPLVDFYHRDGAMRLHTARNVRPPFPATFWPSSVAGQYLHHRIVHEFFLHQCLKHGWFSKQPFIHSPSSSTSVMV
ncbi:hypothetical protein EUGRSUZ_C02647 [Eucalyptus grandis]|uniref:Uncharacterized protein n=2 Tax=Eucalyptus grandis TaxID=71139 RepID=A0ACC3LI54_EUCGR|nr:hypothetical protein EUGRSUZ_C02647 [Eucalyptus grandis]